MTLNPQLTLPKEKQSSDPKIKTNTFPCTENHLFLCLSTKTSDSIPKVQKSSQRITPFSGVCFTDEAFNQTGLSQLIDTEFGIRSVLYGYQYRWVLKITFLRIHIHEPA